MPIVTISRMYGSGGSDVAALIARRLGWALLDNALVDQVAQRLGVTPEEVEARAERVPSLVERLADTLALGTGEFMTPVPEVVLPPSEELMVDVTRRVVEEAAAQGPVVLVGRGAQALLAEREDAVHVLCVAPRPALVARIQRRLGITRHEAEKLVDDTNRQREQFVKRHWGRPWLAHENYHVCLNTELLGIEGAAEVVVEIVERTINR